jgi:D-inositol-3-phosphate glycosyltransferase
MSSRCQTQRSDGLVAQDNDFCDEPPRHARAELRRRYSGHEFLDVLDDPRKNIGLLLEAYARLPLELRNRMKLTLAGQAGPPKSFWLQAEALGLSDRIEFISRPSAEELIRLYQKASIFALSSAEEGFGVVVLEAMACGIPVVSTRSGGPDDIIIDGDNGYLVPLNDAPAMAERIQQLSADAHLNRRVGTRARATVEKRYAYEVARRPFLEVWDRLTRNTIAAGQGVPS